MQNKENLQQWGKREKAQLLTLSAKRNKKLNQKRICRRFSAAVLLFFLFVAGSKRGGGEDKETETR